MKISMLDLKAEYVQIKKEIDEAVKAVLESGHFILGPNVSYFEEEFAKYIGTQFAIGVASGTDALFLALKALGIKEGDEVITTALSFIATAEAISYTGAKPVFVDVDPVTHNIDPDKIEKSITKKTKAIIPVHLWGLASDVDPIIKTARQHGIFVVGDCAQSAGAEYKGKKVGSLGNAGCFSFFPTKNLGAYGDGGMIVTDDRETYDRIKLLHLHGSKARGVHEIIGYNSRLDEIQAAILRVKLKYLDSWNDKRRANALIYSSLFEKNGIKHPVEKEGFRHVYHQYTIEAENRDDMMKKLSSIEIPSFVYYPNPLHLQKPYEDLGCKTGDFPAAEKIGRTMLSIPVHPFLSKEEVIMVGEAIVNSR